MRAEILGLVEIVMSLDETPVSGSGDDGGTTGEPRRRSTEPSL